MAINPAFAHISHGDQTFQVLVYAPVMGTDDTGAEVPILDEEGVQVTAPVDWDEAATRALYEAWLAGQA